MDALLSNIDPENMALINGKLSDLRRQLAELDTEAKRLKTEAPKTVDADNLRKFAYEKLSRLQEAVTGQGDTVRIRQVLEGYVAKIEVNPKEKYIETYLYRDALPFLPKHLLEDTGEDTAMLTVATPESAEISGTTKPGTQLDLNRRKTCKPIEKPELACANAGFSKCGRGLPRTVEPVQIFREAVKWPRPPYIETILSLCEPHAVSLPEKPVSLPETA